MQLLEIKAQLDYLGEHRLANAVLDRLDQLWDKFDDSQRKELAIAVFNLTTLGG